LKIFISEQKAIPFVGMDILKNKTTHQGRHVDKNVQHCTAQHLNLHLKLTSAEPLGHWSTWEKSRDATHHQCGPGTLCCAQIACSQPRAALGCKFSKHLKAQGKTSMHCFAISDSLQSSNIINYHPRSSNYVKLAFHHFIAFPFYSLFVSSLPRREK
jgi:hypothetical protein